MVPIIIRVGLLIISWSSLIFLPKKAWKKFLPATMFTSLIVMVECLLAIPYKWWGVEGGMKNKLFNDLSFIMGPFFAGTLWGFHFTYGKFALYLPLNVLVNAAFAYPLNSIFERLRVYRLINFRPIHIFLSGLAYSFIIYGYQMLIDRSVVKDNWLNLITRGLAQKKE